MSNHFQMKIKNTKKFVFACLLSFFIVILLASGLWTCFQSFTAPCEVETNAPTADSSNEINSTTNEQKDITISMSVIGDIMCHNTQYNDAYNAKTDTYDFSYVFTDIKDEIAKSDISIGNLETTFAGKDRGYTSYPTFNTPETLRLALKEMGIDVLSTANNHSLDKGYKGIESTLNFLDESEISHMGTYRSKQEQNEVLIKDVNGIKIAFLSYTYGTNGIPVPNGKDYCINLIDKDLMLKHLSSAKDQNVDLICVNMHWGVEYRSTPTQEQKDLADFLFENGADIILGSHPHVLEKMEKRIITNSDGTTKDGFVIYSLGNFVSGQVKENTKNSIILNLEITKHKEGNITIDHATYTPIYCSAKHSPRKFKILDIEKRISDYESGTNTEIGKSMYTTIKEELAKIKKTVGEEF